MRAYAEARGLHNAGKPDSQDICFIPDGDYSRFLNDERPDLSATVEGGEIRNLEGVTLGQHRGYPHYTVGQRKGLGLATGQPQYVVHIEPDTNTLIVGDEADLYHDTCILQQVNLLAIDRLETPMEVRVKIRYHDEGAPATIEPTETDRIRVRFHQPRRAITPGQSAVFYDNDVMVGGGVIVRDGLGPQDRWQT